MPSTRPRNAGEGAPWRRCVVEPRGLGQWLQAADEPGVAVRVRLRDGAAEHVVVWQWQSKSRRLACIAPASCRFHGVIPGRPAAEPVGVIGAHGPSFTPPIRHRRDGRAHRGRGRLALVELLNGGALAARLAVEDEPQLKPAEHAVAHYGAGALLADPRCAKRACAALAALEAAGVEFRLRHARAALERLDAGAPAAAPSAELVDDDDDEADSVASGPSRVADLGAGSVRSVRTRRTSSPRTVPDVPEDPWPSPRLDPASCRFSAAAFLLPSDPRAAA